jgi:hypothetical protein
MQHEGNQGGKALTEVLRTVRTSSSSTNLLD